LRGVFTIAAICAAGLIGAAFAEEPSPPPTAAAVQPNRAFWQAQIAAARARHDDWLSCIRARRFKCDKDEKPSPMDALLNDDTLVAGDIVATPQGLKVFRGQTGAPHRLEDFK
jgi:hypothetical protein